MKTRLPHVLEDDKLIRERALELVDEGRVVGVVLEVVAIEERLSTATMVEKQTSKPKS